MDRRYTRVINIKMRRLGIGVGVCDTDLTISNNHSEIKQRRAFENNTCYLVLKTLFAYNDPIKPTTTENSPL